MKNIATIALLTLASAGLPASGGVFISADATINLAVTGPVDTSTSPHTSVRSEAVDGDNAAKTRADSNASVGSSSVSMNYFLNHNVSGTGLFRSDFTVNGNAGNVPLPLSFHYVVTGGMSVTTSALFGGIAEAGLQVTVHTGFDWGGGSATLFGQSGGTSLDTRGDLVGQSISSLASLNLGLSLFSETRQSGLLVVDVYTIAFSSEHAVGRADFSVQLTSITVPTGFDAVPVSGLSVTFDSGFTLPISVEAVPEPSTLLGLSLGALLAAARFVRRRG